MSDARIDGGGDALQVGSTLPANDPAVPGELRQAMERGTVVLFFLRAFT